MEKELLEKLVKNTEPKQSFQFLLSNNNTSFNTRFNPPIVLDGSYEIALVGLETYYSFPNVDERNNLLNYSFTDKGRRQNFIITIPLGSYEINSLNKEIQKQLAKNGHEDAITIEANKNTLKSVMTIKKDFAVYFAYEHSINSLLGFNPMVSKNNAVYSEGVWNSQNIVNILSVNTIYVSIDIINGSYINGESRRVIYSFFPNVSPGYKIVEIPHNLVYLPLATNTIDHVMTTITDQNFIPLNLRGETITMRFHLRQV